MKLPTTGNQKIKRWGTIFDYQEKVPTQFAGKSFHEAWHDDIDEFNKMTNEEKWQMGYWVEHSAAKAAGKVGLAIGFLAGMFVAGIWSIYLIR